MSVLRSTWLPDAIFDHRRLDTLTDDLRREFYSTAPWPHLIVDNFLPVNMATRAAAEFPPLGRTKALLARLLGARSYGASPADGEEVMSSIFGALHGSRFTTFLERLTGIQRLQPDVNMIGAGFHHGAHGSYLPLHADHNTHPSNPTLFRRINAMLYLNEEWDAQWNGDLELWDREAKCCQRRIAPKFNRCVIMYVDDTAYHKYGPLRVPKERTRKALAAYYYSEVPAPGQTATPHSTVLATPQGESFPRVIAERARRATLFRVETALRTLEL